MGDDLMYYAISYEAFNAAGCDVTEFKVFPQPSADPDEAALRQRPRVGRRRLGREPPRALATARCRHGHAKRVGTGRDPGWRLGRQSLLAPRRHDRLVRSESSSPITNALGFLPYANGVHYDGESQRRPLLHQLMKSEVLSPLAYATDNTVGIWYEGHRSDDGGRRTPRSTPTPVRPRTRSNSIDGEIVETRFGVGSTAVREIAATDRMALATLVT